MRKAPALAMAFAVAAALALGGCAGAGSSASSEPGITSGIVSRTASAAAESVDSPTAFESGAGAPEQAVPSSGSANESRVLVMSVNGQALHVTLAESVAADALAERLAEGPVTVNLRDYGGFEKVGPLPWALPASDEQVTARPGDVMLYQGDQITVFTGSNSWAYTPLGHVRGLTADSLLESLGEGDVEAVLSL